MYAATDKALKILLRDKRIFVACYNPVKGAAAVDFATGEQDKTNKISFTNGAMLSSREVRSFAKERVITGVNIAYLLLEDAKVEIDLATRVVVSGITYNVKGTFDSFYSKWELLVLERSTSSEVYSPEVQGLHASDRSKACVDWLVNEVKILFNNEIPEDLILWPLVGFNLAQSLQHIYPVGGATVAAGQVEFTETGRRSGYSGTGTVDGSAPKRALSYGQTNYNEVLPLIDQFNTYMGRL